MRGSCLAMNKSFNISSSVHHSSSLKQINIFYSWCSPCYSRHPYFLIYSLAPVISNWFFLEGIPQEKARDAFPLPVLHWPVIFLGSLPQFSFELALVSVVLLAEEGSCPSSDAAWWCPNMGWTTPNAVQEQSSNKDRWALQPGDHPLLSLTYIPYKIRGNKGLCLKQHWKIRKDWEVPYMEELTP